MSISLKLGTVTKRVNSTLVPNTTSWSSYDVLLKKDTSLESPVFVLQGTAATFAGYNYAVGGGFLVGNYWINDVVSVANGRCEIYCTRDYLADNKSKIMSTSAFIEYGFNTFNAGDSSNRVSDQRQTISENPAQHVASFDPFNNRINNVGSYILQVVGSSNGLKTYVSNSNKLHSLIASLNSQLNTDVSNIITSADPAEDKLNQLLALNYKNTLLQDSAVGAIKSCIWVPVYVSTGNSEEVYLGDWNTHIYMDILADNVVYTETATVAIPWPVSDWRRNNCQVTMYIPFFGTIPIPIDQCVDITNLSTQWSFEAYSGDIAITVSAGNYVVFTGSANISSPYGIGTSRVSASGQISGTIQQVGGGIQMAAGAIDTAASVVGKTLSLGMLGDMTSGINTMVSGAQNAFGGYLQTIQPTITSTGLTGGLASLGQPLQAKVAVLYYAPLDNAGFSGLYGHPVMKVATPVAGFCKTRGFSLAGSDRVNDISFVNAAMDGGVFIE